MKNVSERLIILEGPDGAGKTTLAKRLAADLRMHYVHLGPFRGVRRGEDLARLYVEAMMPAVLGHAPVVMDRSWLSEPIYGRAFRDGEDRLGTWRTRILERLAWRCRTTVAYCLPPFDACASNFLRNAPDQMLTRMEQLREVYGLYAAASVSAAVGLTSLPSVVVDPLGMPAKDAAYWACHVAPSSLEHPTNRVTAGNMRGAKMLVVTASADWLGADALYRWPAGSFDRDAMRVVEVFHDAGLSERDLYWAHAEDLTEAVAALKLPVVTLGFGPTDRVRRLGREPDAIMTGESGADAQHLKELAA